MQENDLVASVAESLDLDLGELRHLVGQAEANRRTDGKRADSATVNRILREYYTDAELERCDFRRYGFTVGGGAVSTWLAGRPHWRGMGLSTQSLLPSAKFVPLERVRPEITEVEVAPYLADIVRSKAQNWDNPIFRLLLAEFNGGNAETEFASDTYLRYRFTTGLMREEVFEWAAGTESFDSRRPRLPLRERWLPTGSTLANYRERICAGGVNVLVALARPEPDNDYALFLHQRSRQVSEGRDDLSVIPMGYHESMHNPALEVDPAFSVFRELYEELFGGREEVRGKAFARPRFFYRGNAPLEWLRANSASFELVLTAFGINLLQGNYDFAYILAVEDTSFWSEFGPDLILNWESAHGKGLDLVSSQDADGLRERLQATHWAGSALMTFVEGLKFLAGRHPEGIRLPADADFE